VSGIQNLELRAQNALAQTVNFKTFTDAGPSSILVRNETARARQTSPSKHRRRPGLER